MGYNIKLLRQKPPHRSPHLERVENIGRRGCRIASRQLNVRARSRHLQRQHSLRSCLCMGRFGPVTEKWGKGAMGATWEMSHYIRWLVLPDSPTGGITDSRHAYAGKKKTWCLVCQHVGNGLLCGARLRQGGPEAMRMRSCVSCSDAVSACSSGPGTADVAARFQLSQLLMRFQGRVGFRQR